MEIFDLVGEEIKPGHLVAFSKGNEHDLQVGIVVKINADSISYLIKSRRARYSRSDRKGPRAHRGYRRRGKFLGYSDWKVRLSHINIKPGKTIQGRFVVVKSPMFLLDNENIAAQLEIMDMAKDAELLPKDYELGKPF